MGVSPSRFRRVATPADQHAITRVPSSVATDRAHPHSNQRRDQHRVARRSTVNRGTVLRRGMSATELRHRLDQRGDLAWTTLIHALAVLVTASKAAWT
jgi:hypothetical protein